MRSSWPTRPTVSPKSPEVNVSQRRDAPVPSASSGDSDRATPIGDPPGQHAASAPAAPIDHPAAAIEQAAPSAPSADRNPDAKVHPEADLAGRTIGISRDRLIGNDGMEERVRIVNHAERDLAFAVELELGCDAADIFEVRGYPRPERGTLLPIALTSTRATFRYDGLDGMRRSTHIAFSTAADGHGPIDGRAEDAVGQGGSVRYWWNIRLAPGERRDLHWTIWSTTVRVGEGRVSDDERAQASERALV